MLDTYMCPFLSVLFHLTTKPLLHLGLQWACSFLAARLHGDIFRACAELQPGNPMRAEQKIA